jgi:FixJ family two-component response regulator
MGKSPPPLVALVDDDLSVRRALRRLIGAAGFAVEAFASGPELLDSNAIHSAGCVVLDIHLGAQDGFEVQQSLAALGLTSPIVFITADETEATSGRALRAGAIACLRKPFLDGELIGAIRKALGSQ